MKCAIEKCKNQGEVVMEGLKTAGGAVEPFKAHVCRACLKKTLDRTPVSAGFSFKPMEPVRC